MGATGPTPFAAASAALQTPLLCSLLTGARSNRVSRSFEKYNAVLRGEGSGSRVPMFLRRYKELTKGNRCKLSATEACVAACAAAAAAAAVADRWGVRSCAPTDATTIHVINSALIRLSKLQQIERVYRGFAGGVLPESFLEPNEYNVKGGLQPLLLFCCSLSPLSSFSFTLSLSSFSPPSLLSSFSHLLSPPLISFPPSGVEFGFLSTTTNKDVAMHYAAGQSSGGKPAIVLQMEQGMIDRGADLGWLSQYPHEAEASVAHARSLSAHCSRMRCPRHHAMPSHLHTCVVHGRWSSPLLLVSACRSASPH